MSVDIPGEGVQSAYSSGRLVVTAGGRSVSFAIDSSAGVARVVEDTYQQSVSVTEIPEDVVAHVLYVGYRIHGDNIDDGGFTLLRGDER
ncbi:hypothetical protein [Natronosalvus caseinilyticus]|uniref:hypothetical protein n=1 Tax=Natronosalvus caseinilyticus TaxID=2953747 RepID=UPI0028B0CD36|nr:hypothetical protein [Natronosalvus caseinilyticus]